MKHHKDYKKYCGGIYYKIIKETLERDKYKCKKCGRTTHIIVHHLDSNRKNHKLENLITLCRYCHSETHGYITTIKNPKTSLIIELRNNNKTFQEIGDYLGISRQRVHQIIKKTAT